MQRHKRREQCLITTCLKQFLTENNIVTEDFVDVLYLYRVSQCVFRRLHNEAYPRVDYVIPASKKARPRKFLQTSVVNLLFMYVKRVYIRHEYELKEGSCI